MPYKLTGYERETHILFNEEERTAHISTFNGTLIRKLTALCESRPDETTGKGPDQNGEYAFTIPKKWIRVNASLVMTDEQKQERSERGKRNIANLKQFSPVNQSVKA